MTGRFVFYYPRAMVGDGGPTRSTWGWAEALANLGHSVLILHAEEAGPRRDSGLATREIAHRGSGRRLRPVRLSAHLKPDDTLVLTSGYTLHNLVAAREARRNGTSYVVRPVGAYNPEIRKRRGFLKRTWEVGERNMLDGALAVHLYFKSEVDHLWNVARRASPIVAPDGAGPPSGTWVGGGGFVAWVGRYDIEHKGIDLLIDAVAATAPEKRPHVVLHGRDSRNTRAQVVALVHRRGLHEWVEVLGPIDGKAKAEFLSHADAYVHPSRWEAYGIALVENLAMGVPCVVSRGADIARDLAASDAAIVVEPNPAAIAAGIQSVAAESRGLSVRARKFVETKLDWPVVAQSFVDQLNEHLKGPSG